MTQIQERPHLKTTAPRAARAKASGRIATPTPSRTLRRASRSGRPSVSVIIPAMNEANNLPHVLPHLPPVHEVILVDGRSTDGTADVARRLVPGIRIVEQRGRGKGDALRAGLEAATGDIVVMMDADGSTDPAEIPLFVEALENGADYAKGSRFIEGGGTSDMTTIRRLGNAGLLAFARLLHGGTFTDLCYGYNAFWRRAASHLKLDTDGFEIETLMNIRALRAGLRVEEIPSFERDRINGESNLRSIPDGLRVLRTIVLEWVRPVPVAIPVDRNATLARGDERRPVAARRVIAP